MRVRCRPTRVKNLKACADAFTSDPVQRSRYGSLRGELAYAWMTLLRSGSLISVVLEDIQPPVPRLVGLGLSVFVNDQFLSEQEGPPVLDRP